MTHIDRESSPESNASNTTKKPKPTIQLVSPEKSNFLWDNDDKFFLGQTKLTTSKLQELFGNYDELPWNNQNGWDEEEKDKRFVYRISIGKKHFVIYDKLGEDENGNDIWDDLDDIEWFANGDGALKTLNSLNSR